jgi:hypothetical protein
MGRGVKYIYIDNKDLDQKRAAGREQQLGHGGKSREGVGVFSEKY